MLVILLCTVCLFPHIDDALKCNVVAFFTENLVSFRMTRAADEEGRLSGVVETRPQSPLWTLRVKRL